MSRHQRRAFHAQTDKIPRLGFVRVSLLKGGAVTLEAQLDPKATVRERNRLVGELTSVIETLESTTQPDPICRNLIGNHADKVQCGVLDSLHRDGESCDEMRESTARSAAGLERTKKLLSTLACDRCGKPVDLGAVARPGQRVTCGECVAARGEAANV